MRLTPLVVSAAFLFLVVAGIPLNTAHGVRITTTFVVSHEQGVLNMGFTDARGELIPHVKVIWYVWNSSEFPPLSITNLILITHTGNYTVQGSVVIDVKSFDTRTNSTGWATLRYDRPNPNPCLFLYLVSGEIYSGINHLPAVGGCS